MEMDQDTLRMAHDIEAAGLERKPAEAISQAIHEHGRPLATKADVERLEKSTAERFEQLGKATKADVAQLRQETRERFDRLETSTDKRFERLEVRLDQMNMTIMGFGSAMVLTLIGAIITMAFKM